MSRGKATLFIVREWAGSNGTRFWATLRWGGDESLRMGDAPVQFADKYGACLDCPAAPTRKGAEKIGREYAKTLGLTLPKMRHD